VPAAERRELAPAQRTAEKHCQTRTVPFSFHSVDVGLSEQVASLFPGEPVPCPVDGLARLMKILRRMPWLGYRTAAPAR
jgi:hypothetical protein